MIKQRIFVVTAFWGVFKKNCDQFNMTERLHNTIIPLIWHWCRQMKEGRIRIA